MNASPGTMTLFLPKLIPTKKQFEVLMPTDTAPEKSISFQGVKVPAHLGEITQRQLDTMQPILRSWLMDCGVKPLLIANPDISKQQYFEMLGEIQKQIESRPKTCSAGDYFEKGIKTALFIPGITAQQFSEICDEIRMQINICPEKNRFDYFLVLGIFLGEKGTGMESMKELTELIRIAESDKFVPWNSNLYDLRYELQKMGSGYLDWTLTTIINRPRKKSETIKSLVDEYLAKHRKIDYLANYRKNNPDSVFFSSDILSLVDKSFSQACRSTEKYFLSALREGYIVRTNVSITQGDKELQKTVYIKGFTKKTGNFLAYDAENNLIFNADVNYGQINLLPLTDWNTMSSDSQQRFLNAEKAYQASLSNQAHIGGN